MKQKQTTETCKHCGERFAADTAYPVIQTVHEGTFQTLTFCTEACLAAWRDAQ